MPKFASDLLNYVQTFLERLYERCRTSYMEAGILPYLYHIMLIFNIRFILNVLAVISLFLISFLSSSFLK